MTATTPEDLLADAAPPRPVTPPPAAGEGPWDPPRRLLTAGLLMLVAATAFEALAVATIMPAVAADLDGLVLYGWAFSSFMLANMVGIVFAGGVADRSGPLIPFVLGVAVLTIGLILGGVAASMWILILARILQGFAGGCVSSIAYVTIGRGYPAAAKPKMLALLSSAWVVPGLIGPAVSGVITDQVGWRWVFLALIPLPPLAAAMVFPGLRRIPAGRAAMNALARIRHAVQLALGAGLFLAGLGWRDRLTLDRPAGLPVQLDLAPPLVAVVMVLGGVLFAVPALRSLLPPGTLRAAAGLPAAVATMGLLNVGFFGVDAFVPLALVDVRGQTIIYASLALTGATITWTIGSWLQARFSATASRRRLIQTGLIVVAVGCALFLPVLAPAVPVLLGPVSWTLAGLGMGLAFSTLSLVVLETAPAGQEGAAAASLQLANVLGGGLGTGIGGALVGSIGAADGQLRTALTIQEVAMIVVLVVAVAAAARLPNRPPAPSSPAVAPLTGAQSA
ncbi:MAG: MFS transporter [Chloroflexota bacterium]|nr:MFS transporter [Chloroflexota bacterium]